MTRGDKALRVGMESWVIQDGNYGDFEVGQETECAIEFESTDLRPVRGGTPFAEHVKASRYRIRAQVLFSSPGVWVVDAGRFMAFGESGPPNQPLAGSFVEGIVDLSIDPFLYSGELVRLAGMPLLAYTWVVREILRETTPWLEARDPFGRTTRARDVSKESFASVARTDGWNDDNGHGHYILALERVAGPHAPL